MWEKNLKKNRCMYKWVKVDLSCPTLCDPMNYTVHGILQARTLEMYVYVHVNHFAETNTWN